ncbi:hypothetical protein MPH_03600 [Macrophomina phaseolina MS6]|uniref:Uncharacterized protein n=1 Tax=Macrophomina phaseolina (strain MS6) TaxID=1126212 RepID=K2S9I6_MACPH|nr:hypothetical protein MPH_03600 [Macrophomina phaseolina MS6]
MPGAILENVITQFPPPKVVPSETKRATRPTKKLPQFLIDDARISTKETFDPKKHLAYQPPAKVYTMADIGLEGHGVAPTAVSEPFPLFTEEAIKQMRAEVFSDEVMQHCQYMSGFTPNMVRGMGAERAPFTYDAWKSAELLARVSEVAGVELVPAVDFEIANVNISVSDANKTVVAGKEADGDDTSAFAWHYDSFPFVCVVMLSDCTGMVGGETALRMPTGEIRKARGPSMVGRQNHFDTQKTAEG